MTIDSRPMGPVLLLCATRLELDLYRRQTAFDELRGQAEVCGFGPVAAAAKTAQLLAESAPRHVMLLGIAGTYDRARLDVGQAACFQSVAIDGIGAGAGRQFLSASAIGFHQIDVDAQRQTDAIGDTLDLIRPVDDQPPQQLLTCCASSASAVEAEERKQRFPDTTAEDMEGFGVALACRLFATPITIVRGISNQAGDRDKSHWRIDDAIAASWTLASKTVNSLR